MKDPARFREAIRRFDEENGQDPRIERIEGEPFPREVLFATRVYEWVNRLLEVPSEEVLLAARAHTLRRWDIPRDRYPRDTTGYHQWRSALAEHHADHAVRILVELGYPDEAIAKVKAFIIKSNWPENAEAAALEDADCLVFLEMKLAEYIEAWDEDKMFRVLKGTFRKMTPQGRKLAMELSLGERERTLLQHVVEG